MIRIHTSCLVNPVNPVNPVQKILQDYQDLRDLQDLYFVSPEKRGQNQIFSMPMGLERAKPC